VLSTLMMSADTQTTASTDQRCELRERTGDTALTFFRIESRREGAWNYLRSPQLQYDATNSFTRKR
jgi:hypothetical protein